MELIQKQIDSEKTEIRQNQAKIKRLNLRNLEKRKNKRGCRFWIGNQKDRFKIKNYDIPFVRIKENIIGKKKNFRSKIYQRNKLNLENFYGLAKSGKVKNQILIQNKDNRIYRSKYAQVNEFKEENNEFKPTKMTTLVTKPKNENEDLTSFSSELEKEMLFQTSSNNKFQRLGAINDIKIDEKNIKRNRRMFSFMLKHLKEAQKEHKFKKNTTLKLIYMAKELREKQSKFVQKKI